MSLDLRRLVAGLSDTLSDTLRPYLTHLERRSFKAATSPRQRVILVEALRLQPVLWVSLRLGLLDARVELVAQLLGIDRRTDGDNLCARCTLPPLIQFRFVWACTLPDRPSNMSTIPIPVVPFMNTSHLPINALPRN